MASSSDENLKRLLKPLQDNAREMARKEHMQAKRNKERNPRRRSKTGNNTNRQVVESSEKTRLKMKFYVRLLEEMLLEKTTKNKSTESIMQKTEASNKELRTRIKQLEEALKTNTQFQSNTASQPSTFTSEREEEEGRNELGTAIHLNTAAQPSTHAMQRNEEETQEIYDSILEDCLLPREFDSGIWSDVNEAGSSVRRSSQEDKNIDQYLAAA